MTPDVEALVYKELHKLVHKELNKLRGRTAGYVEACELPERKERTIISTVKSFSYDTEAALIEAISKITMP